MSPCFRKRYPCAPLLHIRILHILALLCFAQIALTQHRAPFYTFKYDQTLCDDWDDPAVNECRGAIIERADGWYRRSYPFDKFFNQQESMSPVSSPARFTSLCDKMTFVEKADGSCIQMWCRNSIWHVSTLARASNPDFDSRFTK